MVPLEKGDSQLDPLLREDDTIPECVDLNSSLRIQNSRCSRCSVRARISTASLIALLLLLACFSTYLLTAKYVSHPLGSFHSGFVTEFPGVYSSFNLQREIPYGNVHFEVDKHMHMDPDSPAMRYSGTTHEVDRAWAEAGLVHGHWFLLTDDEAHRSWGSNYSEYWDDQQGGYAATLDVFHQIHCLDSIRRAIHPEAYAGDPRIGSLGHLDHCLATLLQDIQCKADATLVPTSYRPIIGRNYLISEQYHTCRNFSQVQDWVTRRVSGDLSVPRRSKDSRFPN